MKKTALLLASLLTLTTTYAVGRDVGLEWDPVDDARVVRYELAWGLASGAYESFFDVDASFSAGSITLAKPGIIYIAVRACGDSICSDWSNELAVFWPNKPMNLRFIP